jgi:hypothetical protein
MSNNNENEVDLRSDEYEKISCLWDEVDDEGNVISCEQECKENCDYCQQHFEENEEFLKLLKIYIFDLFDKEDKTFIKQLNKEEKDWKKFVQSNLNMSRLRIKKFCQSKLDEGKTLEECVTLIDEYSIL